MSKLLFTKTHEWVKIDGNTAEIGLSDHAQHELGDIVFVNIPEEGASVYAGEAFCDVESVKAASDVNSPVTGKIIEVNNALEDDPGAINSDPMGSWICKVEVASVPDDLMDEAQYAAFIK